MTTMRPSECPECGNRGLSKVTSHTETPSGAEDYLCSGPEGCGKIVRVTENEVQVREDMGE